MIIGLGVDLIENERMARELANGEWLVEDGIFSPLEIAQCRHGRRPALRYAGCFAAKEATLKALGLGIQDLGMFREIEVNIGRETGTTIGLHGRLKAEFERLNATKIRACVASTRAVTTAMVVLEA